MRHLSPSGLVTKCGWKTQRQTSDTRAAEASAAAIEANRLLGIAETERDLTQRTRRFLRQALYCTAALLVFAVVIAWFATSQWRSAESARDSAESARNSAELIGREAAVQRDLANHQTTIATSRFLGAQALSLVGEEPDLPLLLSVEALAVSDTFEARNAIMAVQYYSRLDVYYPGGHSYPFSIAAFSRDRLIFPDPAKHAIRILDYQHRRALNITLQNTILSMGMVIFLL
jgi:hypothetical protein